MKEILFNNLDEIVIEKDNISYSPQMDKWGVMPYDLGDFSGKMLFCAQGAKVKNITLDFKVKGWYKIYFGSMNFYFGTENYFSFGNGRCVQTPENVSAWMPNEFAEESFVRAMDLTDKKLTLSRPENAPETLSCLMFVRLVEMTDEEIEDYCKTTGGRIAYHFDQDYLYEAKYDTIQDFASRVTFLENTHGGVLLHETFLDNMIPSQKQYIKNGFNYIQYYNRANKNIKEYLDVKEQVRKQYIDRVKKLGFSVYATKRIAAGNFIEPYSYCVDQINLRGKDKYKIETRDGRSLNALSYAYNCVRKNSVRDIIASMGEGEYDGVAIEFHRGVFTGFEKPILERVEKLYGVDARTLPYTDKRLWSVWSYYIIAFLRTLRKELDKKYGKGKVKIMPIVFYGAESSKYFGFDVDKMLKLGLIDSVAQGMMDIWEDLENCLDGNGLIDLEKYKEELKKRYVVKRVFDGNDVKRIVDGAKSLKKICDKYGVDFYATLCWQNDRIAKIREVYSGLCAIGIEKFFSWNTNHKCKRLPIINLEKQIGRGANLDDPAYVTKYHKVMKYGDNDISSWNVHWNG